MHTSHYSESGVRRTAALEAGDRITDLTSCRASASFILRFIIPFILFLSHVFIKPFYTYYIKDGAPWGPLYKQTLIQIISSAFYCFIHHSGEERAALTRDQKVSSAFKPKHRGGACSWSEEPLDLHSIGSRDSTHKAVGSFTSSGVRYSKRSGEETLCYRVLLFAKREMIPRIRSRPHVAVGF